jgi:hypothetical protein
MLDYICRGNPKKTAAGRLSALDWCFAELAGDRLRKGKALAGSLNREDLPVETQRFTFGKDE